MTDQQYEEYKEKVNKYSEISSEIGRLKLEKSRVNSGIIEIKNKLGMQIDCWGRYECFQDNLTKSLIHFYDTEIERFERELSEL